MDNSFSIRRKSGDLSVFLFVNPDKSWAAVSLSYRGKHYRTFDVPTWELTTPAKAAHYLDWPSFGWDGREFTKSRVEEFERLAATDGFERKAA